MVTKPNFSLTGKYFPLTGKYFSLTNFSNNKQIQESLKNNFLKTNLRKTNTNFIAINELNLFYCSCITSFFATYFSLQLSISLNNLKKISCFCYGERFVICHLPCQKDTSSPPRMSCLDERRISTSNDNCLNQLHVKSPLFPAVSVENLKF
jgi:hypothetical protein